MEIDLNLVKSRVHPSVCLGQMAAELTLIFGLSHVWTVWLTI